MYQWIYVKYKWIICKRLLKMMIVNTLFLYWRLWWWIMVTSLLCFLFATWRSWMFFSSVKKSSYRWLDISSVDHPHVCETNVLQFCALSMIVNEIYEHWVILTEYYVELFLSILLSPKCYVCLPFFHLFMKERLSNAQGRWTITDYGLPLIHYFLYIQFLIKINFS